MPRHSLANSPADNCSGQSTGTDSVNFLLNANETVPQAEVLASLRLFAKEVMPAFKRTAAKAAE